MTIGFMFAANLLAASQQAKAQNKAIGAQNAAIAESNLQNTIRTSARASLIGMQAAAARKQRAQSGFDLSAQRRAALSAATANAAASGTVGASVDAVQQDIQIAASDAQARADVDWEITQQNFLQQLDDTIQSGRDSLSSGIRVQGGGSQYLQQLLTAGGQTAMTYMQAKMSLGLGERPAPIVKGN